LAHLAGGDFFHKPNRDGKPCDVLSYGMFVNGSAT